MVWYCVQSKPNSEQRAALHLSINGYRPLLPSYMKTRSHAGRTTIVNAPYFPGYLFVFLADPDAWGPILRTDGVSRLVGNAMGPTRLPERNISELLATFAAGPLPEQKANDWLMSLTDGDTVEITVGMEKRKATYRRLTSAGKVVILMEWLGRQLEFPVHRDQLAAVG